MPLEQGTEIVCPTCDQVMLIARVTITSGMRIGPENFHQVGFKGQSKDRMVCPDCGTPFARQLASETERHRLDPGYMPQTHLFTREGWKP